MPDIEFRSVTRAYEEERGLFDLSFSVEAGEAYAVLSPTGGGKSTLFSLLMGLIRPDSGECLIRGMDCFRERRTICGIASFVPDGAALPVRQGGEQYLRMLSAWQGGVAEERLRDLMEKLDITPMGRFGLMTVEMRRKMAILMGLMRDKPILVLDEPYQHLGPLARGALTDLLAEEKQKGKTILVLTHVLREAQALCDRIAVVRRGRMVVEQKAEALSLRRQKVYHITFDTAETASRFSQEWEKGVELIGSRAIVAIPGSPQTLIKTLAGYPVLDLVGGRDEKEETFLKYHGDEML